MKKHIYFILPVLCGIIAACEKQEINFGEALRNSPTRLIVIDTLTPVLSTVVIDSFETGGSDIALFGRVQDKYSGEITANAFFQVGLPTSNPITANMIPYDAQFDSLTLTLYLDAVYYGDTSFIQTYELNELIQSPQYEYADKLYNTSFTDYHSTPSASVSRRLRPNARDSIVFKFSDTKGRELYDMVKNFDPLLESEDNFLNYLKGFRVGVSNDSYGAIFGSSGLDSVVKFTLHYHHTIPDHISKSIDFPVTRKTYQYNSIINNKAGTLFEGTSDGGFGLSVVYSNEDFPFAISQSGIGYMLKIGFPSIRELLKIDANITILNAELQMEPVYSSYSEYSFKLPGEFYILQTDATNTTGGSALSNSEDYIMLTATPNYIDKSQTRYTANITTYIQLLLNASNAADQALFFLQSATGFSTDLNRAVIASPYHKEQKLKLIITALIIE